MNNGAVGSLSADVVWVEASPTCCEKARGPCKKQSTRGLHRSTAPMLGLFLHGAERNAYNNSRSATVGKFLKHRTRDWESKQTVEDNALQPRARISEVPDDGASTSRGRDSEFCQRVMHGFRNSRMMAVSRRASRARSGFPGKPRAQSRLIFRRSRHDTLPHLMRHYFRKVSTSRRIQGKVVASRRHHRQV